MKKTVCLLLALCLLSVGLFACSGAGGTADTTAKSSENTNSLSKPAKVVEYDSEGNYILTSADNRKVYPTEDGYVVFCFENSTVKKIQAVTKCESEEIAFQMTADYMIEHGKDGALAYCSGDLYIENITKDNEYFKYYSSTKDQIIDQFEKADEQ